MFIHIASDENLDPSYADELRTIVHESMGDPDLKVVVIAVKGWWRSNPS